MAEQRPSSPGPAPSDDADALMSDMFTVPAEYDPPPPPARTETHRLANGAELTLHLVGHSVMDAHHLWNGGRVLADHFLAHPDLVRGRSVLEIGAGAGIPSLVAAHLGAAAVVATDYPDPGVLDAIRRNAAECPLPGADRVVVAGYVWGHPVDSVLALLPPTTTTTTSSSSSAGGVDVVIMADLLFRHTEHANMVRTLERALRRARPSRAFVFFTSYRPWLRERDLKFFDLARAAGLVVEKVLEAKVPEVMFKGDPGDEEVRKTCSGYVLRWPDKMCTD